MRFAENIGIIFDGDLLRLRGCTRPVKVRYCGLCSGHYERTRVHGDAKADEPFRNDLTPGVCEAEGCSFPTRNKAPKIKMV